ncbi:hypothetical protein ACOSQ4_017205 [Xanthoceras sorbifolium]
MQFLPDCCIIKEVLTKRIIDRGDKVHDLYVLNTKDLNSVSLAYINNVSAHVWHNRLGHISFKKLDSLKDQLHCDVFRLHRAEPCYVCPLAKQRQLSFDSHNRLSALPFNLVNCDTWGPYHVPSHSRRRFFLTLIDDCTRFTWVYLMKNKSDVISIVPRFF